ncbi:zona pellucida sperm-binding protein 3-like [Acanthopagrus latus]|uniref:zona pellucida sperm-binding protein 3-like n=1 Tax=Acanthopagrus latus TaxID=8177 RepID=UPI00187C80F7|nr:zona pellucida sperm-binding protein 3-like [Acanthopagrus latus]
MFTDCRTRRRSLRPEKKKPRMDLQTASFWWIIVLISVSTLTESRLTHPHTPQRTRGGIHPQLSAAEQQQSAPPVRRVVVRCHPDSMEVVVQADMFDSGLQVDGRHLRLGSDSVTVGGACGAVPSGEEEFTIRVQLNNCGTKLFSTEEKIIYSNVLVYSPEPSSEGLLRLDWTTIPVECHYEKRYAVDVITLSPAWVQSVSTVSAEDHIDFNLLLMTDDWQYQRGSYSYFLGDPVHFEVSVVTGHHAPLRVYVDRCVATATPDAEATLRYDFIEHHGCLVDAYLTNSRSRFLPRLAEHQLRFQLDAFRFYQEPSNQVYITCHVKAVLVALTVNSQNRACSLMENRWRSVDGNDQACRSCDVSHRVEEPPSTDTPKTTVGTEARQPAMQQESLLQSRPANFVRVRPEKLQQSSAGLMKKRDAEDKAEQAIQLGPITVLPSRKTDKATASKTALSL